MEVNLKFIVRISGDVEIEKEGLPEGVTPIQRAIDLLVAGIEGGIRERYRVEAEAVHAVEFDKATMVCESMDEWAEKVVHAIHPLPAPEGRRLENAMIDTLKKWKEARSTT